MLTTTEIESLMKFLHETEGYPVVNCRLPVHCDGTEENFKFIENLAKMTTRREVILDFSQSQEVVNVAGTLLPARKIRHWKISLKQQSNWDAGVAFFKWRGTLPEMFEKKN